jgi:hypothetical protein
MREMDREEILPLIFNGNAENLAAGTIAAGGISTVALFGERPVAVFGAKEIRPKFWNVFMFATDQWPRVALSVTKNILRVIRPHMIESGAVRADCWSIDGHTDAHRWLELLGAVREATLADYGPTRKSYHCYSWTLSRLERENHVHIPQPPIASRDPGTTPAAGADHARRPGDQRRCASGAPPSSGREGPSVYDPHGI